MSHATVPHHRLIAPWALLIALIVSAAPAGAVPPNDVAPPGWPATWVPWQPPSSPTPTNTYQMHAHDQGMFILQTYFAAAFGASCPDVNTTPPPWDDHVGWLSRYWDHVNGTYYTNAATGTDVTGKVCHEGTFSFDFNVGGNLIDNVTYHPQTWGSTVTNATPWTEVEWNFDPPDPGNPDSDWLFYYQDVITGTPVLYLRDAVEDPGAGDNGGWMYFWPHAGWFPAENPTWQDAMYILESAYFCQQWDGVGCMKDVLVYEGLGNYTVWAYYQVTSGLDSNWDWEGETDAGGHINDFNMIWTPADDDMANAFIVLHGVNNYPNDNYCACDIDARWHDDGSGGGGFVDMPPTDCDGTDTSPGNVGYYNDSGDYPEGYLRAMNLCERYSNVTLTRHGSQTFNTSVGTTSDGSMGVLHDYGYSLTPTAGYRMTMMNSGQVGDSYDTEGGGASYVSHSSYHRDFSVPLQYRGCETAECRYYTDNRYDWSVLEFDVTIPEGIHGIAYDVLMVSSEFPEWVGTTYNDGFEAIIETVRAQEWEVDPLYPGYTCDLNNDGVDDAGNVAFDEFGTPLRINNKFFEFWDCSYMDGVIGHNGSLNGSDAGAGPVESWSHISTQYPTYCGGPLSPPHEYDDLNYLNDGYWCGSSGNYTNSGASDWLTNAFPVQPFETIHVTFNIFDRSDHIYDTFVLLDNWRWLADDPGNPHIYRPPPDIYIDPITTPCLPTEDCDGDGFCDDALACIDGTTPGDCDDTPVSGANYYPGAPELCDGEDNDCNGVVPTNEIDSDGDLHVGCGSGTDYDCVEGNPLIHAGMPEVCGNGIDDNCNGQIDSIADGCSPYDLDWDGYDDVAHGGNDCDDSDPDIHPNAPDPASYGLAEGIDYNCDGWALISWDDMEIEPPASGDISGWSGDNVWYWGANDAFSSYGCASGSRCWSVSLGRYCDVEELWLWADFYHPITFDACELGNDYRIEWDQIYRLEYHWDAAMVFHSSDLDGAWSWGERVTPDTVPTGAGYDSNTYDTCNPIGDGSTWGYTGSPPLAWHTERYTFSGLAQNTTDFGFVMGNDYMIYYYGWAIDNLRLWAYDHNGNGVVCPD